MLRLMSDNDVLGQVSRLMDLCQMPPWDDFWQDLDCAFCRFEDLGLADNASDATVWRAWQEHGVILIMGNRDAEGPDSLEGTIETENGPDCLPVLTLANSSRVRRDRSYAEAVITRLFEILIDIDVLRGSGRLYLP
jgi:hypothetical protein